MYLLFESIAKGASKAIAKGASKAIAKGASKAIAKGASKAIAKGASKAIAKGASEAIVSYRLNPSIQSPPKKNVEITCPPLSLQYHNPNPADTSESTNVCDLFN
jgi:hypothetical protein